MVALTISLVLLGGVMQIFLSNKQSYRVQENLGRIQENGRFAVDLIARTLRMTGWQGDSPGDWVLGSLSTANGGVSALSGTNDDTNNGNTILNGTDTITVIYQGNADAFVKDCQGNAVPVGTNVQNTFQVNITAGDVIGAPAGTVGQLQCVTNPGGSTIALFDGVESFQVQYGIDTDNDQTANSYVTIDNVTDTDEVVSVRIMLLLMSNKDFLTVTPATNAYSLLDASFTEPGDSRLRRRISTTINMRNRL